jgi:hypothetical protein
VSTKSGRAHRIWLSFQDDWRLTDRLTINAGLRWEAELPRKEVDNKMNSFDPLAINPVSGTPGVVMGGVNGAPERAFATDLQQLRAAPGLRLPNSARPTPSYAAARAFSTDLTVSNTIGDVASLGYSTAASIRPPRLRPP